MATTSNTTIVAECSQRLAALEKHAPKGKTQLAIEGERLTGSEVRAMYVRFLELRAAIQANRAELKALLVEANAAEARRAALDKGLRAWVATQFGASSQVAHEFGFPPRKTAVKSVETKHHAVAQSRATRQARHTMGKKQREHVVGVIPSESAAAPEPLASDPALP